MSLARLIPLAFTAAVFCVAAPIAAQEAAQDATQDEYVEPHPSEDRFFTTILTDDDRGDYESLSDERRVEWRARYWASVDPTPTTDENQREMQHQARIVGAIRLFRNQSGQFVFDDRARAYIRFGAPELRKELVGEVVVHEGVVTPREFWLYDDMILWFEDRWINGYYESGIRDIRSLIGLRDQGLREDTGWKADQQLLFEEEFDQFLTVENIEVDPVRARQMTEDGLHRWEETPEINDYNYEGGEEFRFVFDVTHLAGTEGRTDMLLGFLIPLDKVEFTVEGGVESGRIQRRAALFDSEYRMIDRNVENLMHATDPLEQRSRWIVTCDSFSVEPGPYNLALRVVDPASRNHGIMKTRVEAPDFAGDAIRVSDILFSASITRDTRGGGAYVRGDYRIVPRPFRVFSPGEDVEVYFEIYHIVTGEGGRGLYEVEYTLFGTKAERFVSFFGGSSEGKLEQGIGQTFRTQSRGTTANRRISLDTSDVPDDRYTLIIDVRDLASGAVDQAKAQFIVKR